MNALPMMLLIDKERQLDQKQRELLLTQFLLLEVQDMNKAFRLVDSYMDWLDGVMVYTNHVDNETLELLRFTKSKVNNQPVVVVCSGGVLETLNGYSVDMVKNYTVLDASKDIASFKGLLGF